MQWPKYTRVRIYVWQIQALPRSPDDARKGVSSLHLESNSQHSCQTDNHRATEDTNTSEDDQMREATMILGNERGLDRETRQTSKADDSLIHPEPGTERFDRSELCNTGHDDADTGTG
jgi:hypothetical protein